MRLAHTQVCPVLRYLLAMQPMTAASRSASSNTMKGALPPNSSESFLRVPAAWAKCRSGLASNHGCGEIPGRNRGNHSDGLAQDQQAFVGLMARNDIAVNTLALFGEPFDEGGGVGDFAFCFREGLALLGGHDPREVVLVGHHQIEPPAQEYGALFCCSPGPGLEGRGGSLDGLAGRCETEIRNGADLAT